MLSMKAHFLLISRSPSGYSVNLFPLQDLRQFITRVNKVRTEQMGPLSAASLEQGSYQRGYEYIVRYISSSRFEHLTKAIPRIFVL